MLSSLLLRHPLAGRAVMGIDRAPAGWWIGLQTPVLWPAPRYTLAAAPVLGLAVLALPPIAALQSYAGHPLRVVVVEASRWLLDGQLVFIDAPCSSMQMMAWIGCFTACAVALLKGRASRFFLSRLPLVGLAVLAGNVLYNTMLVALQASGRGASGLLHQAIGVVALTAVCVAVAVLMGRASGRRST
jgi:exosortase/archaeosortase family protein